MVQQLSPMKRLATKLASSRAGSLYIMAVSSKIDPLLLKKTDGRWSTMVGQPVLLLKHTGAKSGEPRETPLVYALDGDNIILIASKGGMPKNPAWYHNLKAHPECDVIAKNRSGRYRVNEASGAERDRLWELALDVYQGYDTYQARTGGRIIPVLVLTRA
jgi:deazaflavin-dependent oxidoreductase (nitroreductase family)